MARRILGVLACIGLTNASLAPSAASASDAVPVLDAREQRSPGTPPGLALLGVGAGALVAGLVTLEVAQHGEEACGLSGCFERPDWDSHMIGVGLIGSGLGAAAVGGLGILSTSASDRPRSEGLMTAGMLATGVAVAGVSWGAATLAFSPGEYGYSPRNDYEPQGWVPLLAGVAIGAVGVPLWVSGAATAPASPEPERREPGERYSTGMMVTGIVLSSLGAANVALGVVGEAKGSGGAGLGPPPMLVFGTIGGTLMLIGVPLWVVGASGGETGAAGRALHLALGPTSILLEGDL